MSICGSLPLRGRLLGTSNITAWYKPAESCTYTHVPLCDRWFAADARSVSHAATWAASLALLRGGQSRMDLNSAMWSFPRSPVRTLLRRRLLLNGVRSPRLTHVAENRLLLKTASCDASTSAECFEAFPPLVRGLHVLAAKCCRGLHVLPVRLSLHVHSSQAHCWLEVRNTMFQIIALLLPTAVQLGP